MSTYTVASDNFVLGDFGATVDDDDLGGCNVAALVAGGHLVPDKEASSTAKLANTKQEK